MNEHRRADLSIVEIALRDCFCASEQAGLEAWLARLEGIKGVHLDRTRAVAHLTYDPTLTTPERLRARLEQAGYPCTCRPCGDSSCQRPGGQVLTSVEVGGGDGARVARGAAAAVTWRRTITGAAVAG